ncbi:hypothetical protein BK004_01530 [bacterium CG10_46_32]|nr:MAG: hypothetical protein BK004_01530 [bacterium CG10_46_32]PIR56302.1 MAG: hypothetical protein COU73_01550 [Parcubacteria group bacterium CG10_big_fil_rev_8_21_14_0_10_46_32]
MRRSSAPRILVIEDHDSVVPFIIKALRNVGYVVVAAPSRMAGLARWRRSSARFDVVVLDWGDGRPSAQAVVESIRSDNPDVAVIAIPGGLAPQEVDVLRQAGVVNVVCPKPFGQRELQTAVASALVLRNVAV